MKPATKLNEVARSLYGWSSFHPRWKVEFDSYALRTPDGVVFIDPVKPAAVVIKKLEKLGEPLGVFLTNGNHARDADWFRKAFAVQVYAHEKARSDCETKIDVLVLDGEKLPGGLTVVHLPGASPGEAAYHSRAGGGILFVGDTLMNVGGEGLSFLPEQYCDDSRLARRSARRLLDLEFKTATLAHGAPLTTNAKRQIAVFLKNAARRDR
jgi:glyoxylase-like metal-dependent hydrolase (beta-lactamase superfamily II)